VYRNEAYSVLTGSLIVKKVGSGLEEAISETHLHVGKARELSMELLDQDLGPCKASIEYQNKGLPKP
jgi:hypothetical protein